TFAPMRRALSFRAIILRIGDTWWDEAPPAEVGCWFVKRPSKVVNPGSTLGDSLPHVEEFRIRNTRAVGAVNDACPFSPQRRDAEGHGNAMVSGGINLRAVKLLFSSYGESIRPLFDARSH